MKSLLVLNITLSVEHPVRLYNMCKFASMNFTLSIEHLKVFF